MLLRKNLLLIFLLLILFIFGCSATMNQPLPPEMIAYNSLSEEEQRLIRVSPKDSVLKKERNNDVIASIIGSDYQKEELYTVTFNTESSGKPGKLIVFLSDDKKTALGKLFIGQ